MGVCKGKAKVTDSAGTYKVYKGEFYIIPDLEYDLYLRHLWLREQNPDFDWKAGTWRYRIEAESLAKGLVEEMFEDTDEDKPVYIAAYI